MTMYRQHWQAGEVVVGTSRSIDHSLPDVRPEEQERRRPIIGEAGNESTVPDERPAGSYPGWYGYGELVIDRLLGVARCEVASIAWMSGDGPSPTLVRSKLGIAPHLSVEITNKPPRRICTLDEVVWLENGELYDMGRADEYEPGELALELTTYDLMAEDVIRLSRLVSGYPEIPAPAPLVEFLTAGVAHLESLRSRFPEVESLIVKYAPISRWRVHDNQSRR